MSETREDEKALCVRASTVRCLFGDSTWLPRGDGLDDYIWHLSLAEFVPRGQCETDESLKQLIPYVVLRAGDKIYCYARGKAGGESRLHARLSIGLGGHVNPCDGGCDDTAVTVRRAAYREFEEEVQLVRRNAVVANRFAGLISDDSDAVGRVHLGAVFVFDLISDDIEPREAALADGRWVGVDELRAEADRLEQWSAIVLENLFSPAPVQVIDDDGEVEP